MQPGLTTLVAAALAVVLTVAASPPEIKHFTYEVVEEILHPYTHFTQGLTFRLSDGALLEGTGLEGKSGIIEYKMDNRDVPTAPRHRVDIPNSIHFGEGITELLGKLYQLTWRNGKVHVWDVETLQHLEVRSMPRQLSEGWGACTSPGHDALILSDGSAKLFWVAPDATPDGGFLFKKEVVVKDCTNMPGIGIVGGLNELETVPLRLTHPEETRNIHSSEGSPNFERARSRPHPLGATVWANIYGTQCIAIIDPNNGVVKGYLHIDGLYPRAGIHEMVANGVAYRDKDQSIWVTGKNWDKMFRIKIVELAKPPAQFPKKCLTSWRTPRGVEPKTKYPDDICEKPKGRRARGDDL